DKNYSIDQSLPMPIRPSDVQNHDHPSSPEDKDIEVKGTVTSKSNGETIPGVNIIIKGTIKGTVTDMDGMYALDVPEEGTLIFSSIGYSAQEVPINGRGRIDVTLEEDMQNLEEVVVI